MYDNENYYFADQPKLLSRNTHVSPILSLKSPGPLHPIFLDPEVVRIQFVLCLQVTPLPDPYFRNHGASVIVLVALQTVHSIVCLALQDVGAPLAHPQCRQHGAGILIPHQDGGDGNGEELDLLLLLLGERTCVCRTGGEHYEE